MECRVNFETTTSEFIFITCQIKHFSAQQTYSVHFTSNGFLYYPKLSQLTALDWLAQITALDRLALLTALNWLALLREIGRLAQLTALDWLALVRALNWLAQLRALDWLALSTRWDDAKKTKLKCTSLDDYWPVTCLVKVNTTNLHSTFYDIEIIVSADVNNSKSVAVDSYGIYIYAPNEPQTPECKIPNYNDVCSMNRKDRIESSYISCLAAVPFAKVNCSMIDTSK
ncbi:hypothetical protein Bpfe_022286, partial [Biomphalaria pfeifferi]